MSESFRHDLKGVKSASSVYELFDTIGNSTIRYLLMSSFYLPTDVLTSERVKVLPVKVITGTEYNNNYDGRVNVVTDILPELLCQARYVGVSERWFQANPREVFTVCKLWYGEPPKGKKV